MFWVLFCASLVLFCAQTIQAFGIVAFHAEFFEKKPTIVVDAGHGGEDGGAVGVNGLVEKDVNLAIALALAEDLKAANFPVVLVREGDYSVGDQSLGTIAERKRSDTKSRAQLVEETGECVLISIHQNKFEQSQYSGAQMFYSPTTRKAPPWPSASAKAWWILSSPRTPGRTRRQGRTSTCFPTSRCPLCWWNADSSPTQRKRLSWAKRATSGTWRQLSTTG